jgi:hypothetical protein
VAWLVFEIQDKAHKPRPSWPGLTQPSTDQVHNCSFAECRLRLKKQIALTLMQVEPAKMRAVDLSAVIASAKRVAIHSEKGGLPRSGIAFARNDGRAKISLFSEGFGSEFKLDSRRSNPDMAVPGGLEPPTFGLGNRCSVLLSYGTGLPC